MSHVVLPPADVVVFDEATLAVLHDRKADLRFYRAAQNHYYQVDQHLYQLVGPKFVGSAARYVGVKVA